MNSGDSRFSFGLDCSGSVVKYARPFCINQAKRPLVLFGLLTRKPENAAAVHELIKSGKLPVIGTFQAAGAIAANLFDGWVDQINNQLADEILAARDLVINLHESTLEAIVVDLP